MKVEIVFVWEISDDEEDIVKKAEDLIYTIFTNGESISDYATVRVIR